MSVSFVHVSGEHGLSPLLKYYIVATLRVSIEFGDTTRNAGLIDTGAEINIMTLDLAIRTGFPIRDGSRFMNIVFQIDYFRGFYGVVEEVPVKIRLAVNTVPIQVMEEVDKELVFGIPYIHASRITQKANSDGLIILILSDDSKTIVRFLNALTQNTRNQVAEDIFFLN